MTRSPVGPAQADLSAAQREADEIDLHAGVRAVAGLVADAGGVDDLLRDVAQFAAHAIPAVDGASVALLQPQHVTPRIQTCAATAEFVAEIDKVQYEELHEGPCITSMQTGRVTVSGSLGSDIRWPHFGGRVARMAVHSALSLPLIIRDRGDRFDQLLCPHPRRLRRARRGYWVRSSPSPRGVATQRNVTGQRAGADRQPATGAGQPRGDRSGDRNRPQPDRRDRRGSGRAA